MHSKLSLLYLGKLDIYDLPHIHPSPCTLAIFEDKTWLYVGGLLGAAAVANNRVRILESAFAIFRLSRKVQKVSFALPLKSLQNPARNE